MDIKELQEAITAIQQLPEQFEAIREEFSETLERSKNEFIADINIVNQEIKKEIGESISETKDEALKAVGLVRLDMTKSAIDIERKISVTINRIDEVETKIHDAVNASYAELVKKIQDTSDTINSTATGLKLEINDIIAEELRKQITWSNLFKLLFGGNKSKNE